MTERPPVKVCGRCALFAEQLAVPLTFLRWEDERPACQVCGAATATASIPARWRMDVVDRVERQTAALAEAPPKRKSDWFPWGAIPFNTRGGDDE